MTGAESSKKAEKRAKKQQQALFVAATREENVRLTINSHENVETSTPSTNNGKRKRGPTTLAVIRDHTPLLVEFNERGQPVGVNSEKYATFAGVAAREHVPIVIKDWRLVPSKTKEDLWSLIKQRFIVNESQKHLALRNLGDRWRQYKSEITTKIKEANKKTNRSRALALIRPKNVIFDEDWEAFVKHRLSPEFEEISKKFRNMRNEQEEVHTMGRRGYARTEHNMKKKCSDPTKITRVDVWLEGHRKKNGEPANEAVGRRMEKVVEYQEIDNNPNENIDIRNDAVAKAYGSEKRGRVRARGFGVTPIAENLHNRSTQKVRELESQLHTQSQRVEILEQKFEQMTAFMLKQNPGRPDDVMSAHECTPRSQQGSGTMHENLELENASCQLLHWYSDDPVEVVAEGKVASTDPKARVHHVPLGRDCWKVWVESITLGKEDVELYKMTDEARTINEALGSTVAWPRSCIKLI
ncbi:hypothetical protein KPL70_025777 [Citrus sinensis]|nr:hypothetical protein KPL70_025777 [Citrus sinensis]